MSTLVDTARTAAFIDGYIVVRMESGLAMRFPVSGNPRLAKGTADQLNNIEISPFGLHRPDLDEDLSFRGIAEGNFGQYQKEERPTRRSPEHRKSQPFAWKSIYLLSFRRTQDQADSAQTAVYEASLGVASLELASLAPPTLNDQRASVFLPLTVAPTMTVTCPV
jgi:hypothetical protein